MKRISLVLIALFIFGNTYSQDLLKHVPKSSIYVFAINGNNLDQKMSLKELEKLPFFQSGMKEMFNKKRSSDDINFESAGVALNSPSYLFVQLSDSMTYVGYVMKLSNANLFETFILRDQKGEIELEKSDNGISTIAKRSRMIAWNNEMAVFMSGNANYNYFRELERERTEEMELELKKEIEEALKETGGKEPEVIIEEVQPIEEPDQPQPVEIVEEVVIDEEIVEEVAVEEASPYEYDYSSDWLTSYENRKKTERQWIKEHTLNIFELKSVNSIKTNSKFMGSVDTKADAYFWAGSQHGLYYDYLSAMTMGRRYGSKYSDEVEIEQPAIFDDNYISSSLYFNESEINMIANTHMNTELAGYYKKMSKAKFNPAFLKYLPGDKIIGYYSLVYNTEAALLESPQIMKPYFNNMPYTERMAGDAIDLMSVLIDEEAIGNLIVGNAIFAITDMSEQEVTYTTYDWDNETFERTEVTKTKTEFIPEMLMMVSTRDAKSVQKIFNLYEKGRKLTKIDNYYKVKTPRRTPFNIYVFVKNNIVFFCSTEEMVKDIMSGKSNKSLGGTHVKNLSKNSNAAFFDGQQFFTKLTPEMRREKDQKMNKYATDNLRKMYLTQAKPKGNKITTNFTTEIPDGYQNSFEYMFSFFNELYRIDKRLDE